MLLAGEENREENRVFPVAIAGQTDNLFFQLGLQVLEAFDSSRFSLEIRTLSESDAHAALSRGEISAYAVIPEGFMEAALSGNILPIRFVTSPGASTMVSVFKDEVSRMISQVLVQSQKGVYGMADALKSNGISVGGHMDTLALTYVEYILLRDQVYTLRELGIGDRLPLREYLLCGLSILFLFLSCLAFGPKLLRPDPALGQLLKSRGKSLQGQLFYDFGAYVLMLLPIGLLPVAGGRYLGLFLFRWQVIPAVLSVVLLCGSMSFCLYRCCANILSGTLLQFFVTVAMCFLCGCMYPVFFFPEALQRLGAWLPAGLARSLLAGCITGEISSVTWLSAWGYSGLFLALSHRKEGL